jgi:alpha-methylacyl-CoA racemase
LKETRPLTDIVVLDFSRLLPGPYCSLVLADLGATVVKIEQPGTGDPLRHIAPFGSDGVGVLFSLVNRGKKSLTLDLKTKQGREIVLQLATRSDVLLESFRPGVMKRLGLDYERLVSACPQLVYASLSGYGQQGPLAGRAGHDVNYAALAGLLDALNRPDALPRVAPVPLADLSSALWATIAILGALHGTETTHRAIHLDLSMLDSIAALTLLPYMGTAPSGKLLPQSAIPTSAWACYGVYRTADGRLLSLGALEHGFWEAFCIAAGHPEWRDRQFAADQGALSAEVAAELGGHPLTYWQERLADVDCCCELVLTTEEALVHPQLRHRGFGRAGWAKTALGPDPVSGTAAPSLGHDNAEVLGRIGYGADDVERLKLQGVI